MPFNFYLLRGLRLLLFPFTWPVALVVWFRNRLYDRGWLKSTVFHLPVICVGNLSVGGTGKSPMTELLLSWLIPQVKTATLSRGYKRRTRGYVLAGPDTTALEIGDEPMLFHRKFPEAAVAVGEERVVAIPMLLHDRPDTGVIILDDAFQHRRVAAGLNILLTEYANPYWEDWFLPTGDLRDERRSARRAQVLVITKCPPDLSVEEQSLLLARINPQPGQQVFFSTLEYGTPYHIHSGVKQSISPDTSVLLVCGIANPAPLKAHVEHQAAWYQLLQFRDHHIFSLDDLKEILNRYAEMDAPRKIVLTTEKDAVRLLKYRKYWETIPLYVQPVSHRILFGAETAFRQLVLDYVKGFSKE